MLTSEIAVFASRFNVIPAHAYTLPAIFDRVAAVAGRPVRSIVSEATYSNLELGSYIAGLAKEVA